MAEKIECNERKRKTGTASATAENERKPIARRNARLQAGAKASSDALAFANSIVCPEDCPVKIIRMRLGPPVDDGGVKKQIMIQPMIQGPGWAFTAQAAWSVTVYCRKRAVPEVDETMEFQQLECGENEEAYASTFARGFGNNAQQAIAKKQAEEEATKKALEAALDAAGQAQCNNPECPTKEITVALGPPTDTTCDQPAAGDPFECQSSVRWAVWVRCR